MKTNKTKPESLLTSFTNAPILICVALAVVIHVLIIGATSIPHLYGTWAGSDAEEAPDVQTESNGARERSVQEAADVRPETQATATKAEPERPLTDIERRVQEVASPDEIPRSPDLLDIDLGDTN